MYLTANFKKNIFYITNIFIDLIFIKFKHYQTTLNIYEKG